MSRYIGKRVRYECGYCKKQITLNKQSVDDSVNSGEVFCSVMCKNQFYLSNRCVKQKNKNMNFNEYQQKASTTAKYPSTMRLIYPTLGLAGESGEVCEKVKKLYRDDNGVISFQKLEELKRELGDVLWYVSAICTDLGINMQEVAELNISKLQSRLERNVIHGNGDDR